MVHIGGICVQKVQMSSRVTGVQEEMRRSSHKTLRYKRNVESNDTQMLSDTQGTKNVK